MSTRNAALNSAFQASPWETISTVREPNRAEDGRCHRDLSKMNANDAKGIGEEPWEFCMEDVRQALEVSLAHPPRPAAHPLTHKHYQRRVANLRREIERRVD